jgi:EmrB/QacA subfamily drug resistance transporter
MSTEPSVDVTGAGDRRRWWGLAFIALGVAMIIVDATIVNVAVPSIINDLHITSTQAQWIQEAYTLVFASTLLVFGRLADRFGRRLLFLVGVATFTFSSVLAAMAPSGTVLIAARVAQGIGGAMMLPTSLSLLNAGFRGKDRAVAFAIWGSTIGGAAALGPLLGGWLTTSFSWRWAFGINIPLGLAVAIGTLVFVRESKEGAVAGGADYLGAALSVVGFTGIVFGLIEGRNYGWWSLEKPFTFLSWTWTSVLSPVPVAFAVGGAALVLFVALERRRNAAGLPVLLDLGLFRISSFRNGNVVALIVSLGEFGILFSLPLWFQNVRGFSAFETGAALLPLAFGSFAASGLGAQLTQRRGAVVSVRLGILLEIIGIVSLGLAISATRAWWPTLPALFVYGLGVGLATAQITGVVLVDVPVAKSGQGSGTQSTSRQIGSALGIAILGTVLFTALGANLDRQLEQVPGLSAQQRAAAVESVKVTAGAVIPDLESNPVTRPIAQDAKVALSRASSLSAFVAAGFLGLGLLASFALHGRANDAEATADGRRVGPDGDPHSPGRLQSLRGPRRGWVGSAELGGSAAVSPV